MRFLGIDISTYTGMACVDAEGTVGTKAINFPKARGMDRVQLIAQSVRNVTEEWDPSVILIEDYAFGNKNTLVALVELGTAVRLELHRLKRPWYNVPPSVLKQFTTGKGNAKKPDMAAHVLERWNFASKSDDVIDAYALAALGRHLATTNFTELPKGIYHAS